MKLSKEMRKKIEAQRDLMIEKMGRNDISIEEWTLYKTKYDGYCEMLKRQWKVSPDTLLTVGGSLLGILCILNFEKGSILTSKALTFVTRGRV